MKKTTNSPKHFLLAMATGLALVSCKTVEVPPPAPPISEPAKVEQKKKPAQLYEWNGDGVTGTTRINIYLDKQKAEIFKDDQLVGWTYVATGLASHRTPSGEFKVTEKVKDKASNVYGRLLNAEGVVINRDFDARKGLAEGQTFSGAKMPYFMRLTGDGVGLHVGPIPRPGRPASHGCIRVPRGIQTKIFAASPVGTKVKIYDTSPGLLVSELAMAAKEEEEVLP